MHGVYTLDPQRRAIADLMLRCKVVKCVHNQDDRITTRESVWGLERGFPVPRSKKGAPPVPLAPLYVDFHQRIPQRLANMIAGAWREICRKEGYTAHATAGIPDSGTQIGKEFSRVMGLPYVEMEKFRQSSLGCDILTGPRHDNLEPSMRTLILTDDLAQEGDRKEEALLNLADAKLSASHLLTVVDCELGARERASAQDCTFDTIITMSSLVRYYCTEGFWCPSMQERTECYLERRRDCALATA